MAKRIILHQINLLLLIYIIFFSVSYGQIDSLKIDKTHTSIDDSASAVDSANTAAKAKSFLVKFDEDASNIKLPSNNLSKNNIDFSDYRYAGNLISHLPFGFLEDLGSLGTPSEPKIYGFGFGDISLSVNNISRSNLWNGSVDLNRIQTEGMNSIEILPVHKSFLFGFNSNPAHIKINNEDTLRSKPLSRIRYYQASNDEGFIDAFFSARVLPQLALSFRVTNSSIDSNYANSEFGSWKVNLRGIYKIDDSIYTSLEYNHLKLTTPLNGGVDISDLFQSEFNIYDNVASVLYYEREIQTTENSVTSSLYGYLLPLGKSNLSLSYINNEEVYQNNIDTSANKRYNSSNSLSATFQHRLYFNDLFLDVNTGFEHVDYNLESIEYDSQTDNFYGSIYTNYSFASGLLKPGLFAKVSNYNDQTAFGLGAEIIIAPIKDIKLTLGYSNFEKPLSIVEEQFVSKDVSPKFTNLFASIEYSAHNINSSISLYNVDRSDAIFPIMLQSDTYPQTGEIVFKNIPKLTASGINVNSNIEYWNILLSANLNYNWYTDNIFEELDKSYSVFAGIYYVDTLFDNNLNLKTGFNCYLYDMPNESYYDFKLMRSTKFKLENDTIELISLDNLDNDKFRLDFFLAGRIQDAATFYFVYENILGNQYYIVPYFPMPEGGIKIGISWDFLD